METRKVLLFGREITFSGTTEFHIQLGTSRKPYRTYRKLTGNPIVAAAVYDRIRLTPGRKKRLIIKGHSTSYPVIREDVCASQSKSSL